jgi:hypothetical protein
VDRQLVHQYLKTIAEAYNIEYTVPAPETAPGPDKMP